MKIDIIRKKYTFHGGAEGFSGSLIEHLARAGHEVHIFAIKWRADQKQANIHFHTVPAITFLSILRDATFAISTYFILRKLRKDFDIIQTHDKTLYQDIYRAGDGCHIEWLRQRWKRTGFTGRLSVVLNPYHWLILALERYIFRQHRFRKVIAISEMVKRNIMDNYGVSSGDIEVIYNGADIERFHPGNREKFRQEIRSQYGLSDEDFVVLFVGSGFERKGVRYLIEAVERVKRPVKLMVVGKGTAGKLKRVSPGIIFCGPQREIHKYYAAADIFVFPTMYEPFGNVHLEALASGLPVITTKNSGAAEIIEDGRQGFVVNAPEDVDEIAARIELLYNDRDRLRSMSVEARTLAERFTFDAHLEKMMRLYDELVAK